LDNLEDDFPEEKDKQDCLDSLHANFSSSFEELDNKLQHLQRAHDSAGSDDAKEEARRLLRETQSDISGLMNFKASGFKCEPQVRENTSLSFVQPLESNLLVASLQQRFDGAVHENEPGLSVLAVDGDDEDFKRWDQFRTVLASASKRILSVVQHVFKLIHENILKLHETVVAPALIQNGSWQTFDGNFSDQWIFFSKIHIQLFAFEFLMCHSSFERDFLTEDTFERLRVPASNFPMPWSNSNAALWHDMRTGPFEMAKLYCRSLGPRAQRVRNFSDLDILSLLRILVRCSFFCFPLSASAQSLPLLSQSLFIDECVVKRKTARGCLRAMKLWSVFERGSSRFSEIDFLHANICFDDLITQIERCSHLCEKVQLYIITPFSGSERSSCQSSSIGTDSARLFPVSSSVSSSSDTLERQQEEAALDEMFSKQAHEGFFKTAFEETQLGLRNVLLTGAAESIAAAESSAECAECVMRGLKYLITAMRGARPFVRLVMRRLQQFVKAALVDQGKDIDCSGCSVFDVGPMQLSVTSLSPDGVFTTDVPHCFDHGNPLRVDCPIAVTFANVPPSLAAAGVVEGAIV
jgi:hypothetical protein